MSPVMVYVAINIVINIVAAVGMGMTPVRATIDTRMHYYEKL